MQGNVVVGVWCEANRGCSSAWIWCCFKEKEEEEEKEEKEDEDGKVEDDDEEDSKEEKVKKTEKRKVNKWELINKQQPIWLRDPETVSHDEYASFYKSFSSDWDEHLHVKHFKIEGQIEFRGLLYVPKKAPFDMFQQSSDKKRNNIKLYVKKVLITEESNDILPEYLSFVKGIVDSDDLPLNVSREMLQQNSIMKVIKKNLIKKCIDMITEVSQMEDKSKWNSFYESFSKNIKYGIHEDSKNREKLIELLRFNSSKDEQTSFKDYVSRMKEGQNKIYYITAENIKMASTSPFIEKLVKNNIEVLFLIDAIDEYMVQNIKEYDGKELVCCSKDGFELEKTEDDKKRYEQYTKEWESVCKHMKEVLNGRVIDVKISERLSDNPCVLVSDKYGWTANMERLMKAQTLSANNHMSAYMTSRRILEINPNHRLMKILKEKIDQNKEKEIRNIIDLLYDTVLLDSGFVLEEPSKYASKMYRLISLGLSGENDEEIETKPEININKEDLKEEVKESETLMEELD